jgi:hypothetical protein
LKMVFGIVHVRLFQFVRFTADELKIVASRRLKKAPETRPIFYFRAFPVLSTGRRHEAGWRSKLSSRIGLD